MGHSRWDIPLQFLLGEKKSTFWSKFKYSTVSYALKMCQKDKLIVSLFVCAVKKRQLSNGKLKTVVNRRSCQISEKLTGHCHRLFLIISNHGHIYIKSFFDNKFFEMTWWESRCWELHPKNEATLNPQVNVVVIRDWLMEKSFKTQDKKRTEKKTNKKLCMNSLFSFEMFFRQEKSKNLSKEYIEMEDYTQTLRLLWYVNTHKRQERWNALRFLHW